MNYLKFGIVTLAFAFSTAFSFAQSEPVPTLYGDKGGPALEPISEEELPLVPESISEEEVEPVLELVEEEVAEPEPVSEEKNGSNIWYWAAAILLIAGGALWYVKSNKTDSSIS